MGVGVGVSVSVSVYRLLWLLSPLATLVGWVFIYQGSIKAVLSDVFIYTYIHTYIYIYICIYICIGSFGYSSWMGISITPSFVINENKKISGVCVYICVCICIYIDRYICV